MLDTPTVFHSSSPEQTAAFGRRLASRLRPGTVLALTGPLGSGKTKFVKGLASGLGVSARETASPTFTLVHEHAGRIPLIHVDLYRLERPEEVAELGLDDYAERGGILAIEWAERAGGLLPPGSITVAFSITGGRTREITIRPQLRP